MNDLVHGDVSLIISSGITERSAKLRGADTPGGELRIQARSSGE
jgi:hypothetical protein